MPRLLAIVLSTSFALCGCQSRLLTCGGGVSERDPLVTVESVTATRDSPGNGYALTEPLPLFPLEMRRAGVEGIVVVRARVDKQGTVTDVFAISSTQREFERPALNAVSKWKFIEVPSPGVKEPVGMILDCRIKFGFEDE